MAFHISFEQGVEQSFNAGRYFNELAEDMVRSFIDPMTPRQYLILKERQKAMPLRIWSADSQLEDHDKDDLLGWLRSLTSDISRLEQEAPKMTEIERMVRRWLRPRDGTRNYFLEQLYAGQGFRSENPPQLSIAVLGGRLVMLSAPRVMYMQVERDLYGLSIAGSGSYLMEDLHEVPVHQYEGRSHFP